ncbi:MAG: hypothetical protein ACI4WF_01770 [Bacilli bacterium]
MLNKIVMENLERKQQIIKLKNDYLMLKQLVIVYKNAIEDNKSLDSQEKEENIKENTKVKKLVLTKKFYGKDLVVG